ncbi:hypothetical protein EVAR_69089_1 [Eumeta japonica]|uniref:Uncharacterized protein n=1 Tax=Eumeta variegata TaxID=151549 RepID=A0A4C1ZI28_EUMVA|nr:hypothetical protein EVAR_69089_1 [Eumeta japonica]
MGPEIPAAWVDAIFVVRTPGRKILVYYHWARQESLQEGCEMDSTQGGSGQQNVMKLEGSRNWNVWKFQTSVLLRGQGLYKIVDGTTVKPEDDTQRSTWKPRMRELKR